MPVMARPTISVCVVSLPAARHDGCPQHRPARPMARARPAG